MKNYLVVGIAAVLIISTGIVHGFWNREFDFLLRRPPASEKLREFAENLKRVPKGVGNWNGTDLDPIDAREKLVANIDGSLERTYKNLKTGSESSVFIVSGHFRDIAQHTPDQCYVAAGYEMMSEKIHYTIDTSVGQLEAYTTVFKKDDNHTDPHYLRVFWTWSFDGKWVAPKSPRIEFAGQPALYKMYIITHLDPKHNSSQIAEDPSIGFVDQFLPDLNKALFASGSESATGSDPQQALEPAAGAPAPTSGTPAPAAVTPAPVATTPAGAPAVDAAPAEKAPLDAVPADSAPADSVPADGAPKAKAPADAKPGG